MLPVEKMAQKILRRHKILPPYNLQELVSIYGDISYYPFPIDADGITIGIGETKKPQILINSTKAEIRQRFTLAHELGHIIIPWHTGTIVSHCDGMAGEFEYRTMESEANKFAAELLMPTDWLTSEFQSGKKFGDYVNSIIERSQVSRDAALIKIHSVIDVPLLTVRIDDLGNVSGNPFLSGSAPRSADLQGKNVFFSDIFSTSISSDVFTINDKLYKYWLFSSEHLEDKDGRDWREILSCILEETGCGDIQQSINAVLPAHFQKHKQKNIDEISSAVIRAYDGRERFARVVAHPLFKQYVIKRIKELKLKKQL